MRITYQLIESYLGQEIPTIVINIQNQKYLINIPESFQRFTRQHRFKFPKASHIFFTKTAATSVAGLFGFMLTLFEGGNSWDTRLYVQPRLYNYFEEVRYQMGFKILGYSIIDWSGRCRRAFRSMDQVKQLLKRKDYPTQFHNLENYLQKNLAKGEINDARQFLKDGVFKDQNIQIVPFHTGTLENTITNFICSPNRLAGKVIVEKLNQYKVPKKEINKLLTEGQLTLSDGTVIYAKDVKEEDGHSPNFLVIHLKDMAGLLETMKHEVLAEYLKKGNITQSVIYIIEDSKIVKKEEFQQFLKLFGQKAKHILYVQNFYENTEMPGQFRHFSVVSQLAQHFPEVVPNITKNEQKKFEYEIKNGHQIHKFLPKDVQLYKRYHEMVLAPLKNKGYTAMVQEAKKEMELEVDHKRVEEVRHKMQKQQTQWNFKECDPRVVFLGTGSMKPSTYRNVSGILLQMSAKNGILMDCGQGSYYQLLNHFGSEADQALLSIKCIFITHIHSDHNLGILNLLAERRKLCQKLNIKSQIFLIVPYNMAPWIYAYTEYIESLGARYLFVQTILGETYEIAGTVSKDERCYTTPEQVEDAQHYSTPKLTYILANYFKEQKQTIDDFNNYLKEEGIVGFKPVHVIHCPQSYGLVVEHRTGIKISYSGDTVPCQEFVKASEGATLMIHEATFGDDLEDNARENMHSTVGQAIQSAVKANCWRLALTHFSQRYKRAADILQPQQYKDDKMRQYAEHNSIICFDHLQMKLSECEYMPAVSRLAMQMLPTEKE